MAHPKIIISTINDQMTGWQILSDFPERNTFDIYQDTLAINAHEITLTRFRERFNAEERRAMIARYLDPNGDQGYAWEYTARELERMRQIFLDCRRRLNSYRHSSHNLVVC